MTEQELSGNIEIAKMLGWKLIKEKDFNILGEIAYTGENEGVKWGIEEYLKFNSDWNDLMDAVEFIQLQIIKENNEFCIEFYEGLPNVPETFVSITGCNIEKKAKNSKQAVFQAVYEYAYKFNKSKIMKFYINEKTKESLELKVTELERKYNASLQLNHKDRGNVLLGELNTIKEVLANSTVLPVEDSYSNVEFSLDNWLGDLIDNYPNGVIIEK